MASRFEKVLEEALRTMETEALESILPQDRYHFAVGRHAGLTFALQEYRKQRSKDADNLDDDDI